MDLAFIDDFSKSARLSSLFSIVRAGIVDQIISTLPELSCKFWSNSDKLLYNNKPKDNRSVQLTREVESLKMNTKILSLLVRIYIYI